MKEMTKARNEVLANIPNIEIERLLLRKLKFEDAVDIFEYASAPEVTRLTIFDTHKEINDAQTFLQQAIARYEKKEALEFGIIFKPESKLVGTGGFSRLELVNGCGEVGYVLSRSYWGRGVATEALQAIIKFGFEKLKLNRIQACCFEENIASARVMEKAGMKFEGLQRQRVFAKGRYGDVRIYALLRREYAVIAGAGNGVWQLGLDRC
ncbi:MAG: GNAT family protein [candidate division WOR-3 bacterium]